MSRQTYIQSTLTKIELRKLVKEVFVDLPDSKNFENVLTASLDEVVEAYEHFFKTLAKAGSKLVKAVFKQVLGTVLKADNEKLSSFAFKIVSAQRLCYSKSKQAKTGAKLSGAVRRVALLYQEQHKGRPPSPTPSPSPSPSPDPIVVDRSSSSSSIGVMSALLEAEQDKLS